MVCRLRYCALIILWMSNSLLGENTRDGDALIDQVMSERGKVLSAHVRWTQNDDWIKYSKASEATHSPVAAIREGWVDQSNTRLDSLEVVDPQSYEVTDRTMDNVYVFARNTWMRYIAKPPSEAGGPRRGSDLELNDSRIGLIHDGIDINPANVGFNYLLRTQVEPDFAKLLRPDHAEARIVQDDVAKSQGLVLLEINYQDRFRVARFFVNSNNFSIARYEGYGGTDKGKEPTWRSQMDIAYKEYEGGVLFVDEVHYKNWDSGLLTHTCDYKVLSAEINQPVDPVLFTVVGLNLDDNVQILDARLGTVGNLGRIGDFRKEGLLSNLDAQFLLDKKGGKGSATTSPSVTKDASSSIPRTSSSQPVYSTPKAKTKWDAPRIGVLIGGLLLVIGGIHTFVKRKTKTEDVSK